MNEHEDDQMSTEELASHFGEPVPIYVPESFPEETVYAVQARVKNMASMTVNNNLTPVGVQLTNCYTHVLVDLYKLANTMPVEQSQVLKERLRFHEKMVAEFISSVPIPSTPKSREPVVVNRHLAEINEILSGKQVAPAEPTKHTSALMRVFQRLYGSLKRR